jgi:hypothetical protein
VFHLHVFIKDQTRNRFGNLFWLIPSAEDTEVVLPLIPSEEIRSKPVSPQLPKPEQ